MGFRDWKTSFDESIFLEVGHPTGLWREQHSGVHGNCGAWIHLIHTATYEIHSNIRILEIKKPKHRESRARCPRPPTGGGGGGGGETGCESRRVALESMLFSRGSWADFPSTQFLWAGPVQTFISAKHRRNPKTWQSSPALLQVALRLEGFHRERSRGAISLVNGAADRLLGLLAPCNSTPEF